MSVNETCVSISTGVLSPDKRVNYAYGMVLGLGEFLQEQEYFLQKDYLHERALHGYGTVYGLQVTTTPTADDPGDYTVRVDPGMAIDQWGREVVVRSPQCARLGAWLAAQEQAHPGTIAAHSGISGAYTVYVTASYTDCLDDLVPLPGQPCSSSAQTNVASRLRDAWDIELSWDPPPMPAWDTDRLLARLLASVQIVPGLNPSLSSEEEIVAAVLGLPSDVSFDPSALWPLPTVSTPSDNPSGASAPWRLPAETAADALDRIFTVWVTQVRPLLTPSLTSPEDASDPAVLLAAITFTLGTVSAADGEPVIATCDVPDDEGRPYLLHTRLIQELRLLGQNTAPPQANPIELATLTSAVDPDGRLILTAWFHLDEPVALTKPIQVLSRTGATGSFAPSTAPDPSGVAPQFSNVWILTPQKQFPVIDGDQVAVSLSTDTVFVGDLATSLTSYRSTKSLELLDTEANGDVVIYCDVMVPAVPRQTPQLPVWEFVTVTPSGPSVVKAMSFEFWFHPDPSASGSPAVVTLPEKPSIVIVDEVSQKPYTLGARAVGESTNNVWTFQVTPPTELLGKTSYVRISIPAKDISISITQGGGSVTLPKWMTSKALSYQNWNPHDQTITAFVRLEALR